MCKRDTYREAALSTGSSAQCSGWERGSGKKDQEGGELYMHTADPRTAELMQVCKAILLKS